VVHKLAVLDKKMKMQQKIRVQEANDKLRRMETGQGQPQMAASPVEKGEVGYPVQKVEEARKPQVPAQKQGPAPTVTTHLGTKINAQLGLINAPVNNMVFESAFDSNAVSGMSIPPRTHPAFARVEEQKNRYTQDVLRYVLERIDKFKLDPELAKQFMAEIEKESAILFDMSQLDLSEIDESEFDTMCSEFTDGGDETSSIYKSLPLTVQQSLSKQTLDERLRIAKARFDMVVNARKSF
jgi:hypothetical protein